MLDTPRTTEELRERLAKALAESGMRKSEIARRCSDLSQETVTPQTVQEWFKTGRVAKRWLPILEQVLDYPLGYGSTTAVSEPMRFLAKRFDAIQDAALQMRVFLRLQAVLDEFLAEVQANSAKASPQQEPAPGPAPATARSKPAGHR